MTASLPTGSYRRRYLRRHATISRRLRDHIRQEDYSQEGQALIYIILHGLYRVSSDCCRLSRRLGRCCRVGMPGICTAQLSEHRHHLKYVLHGGTRTSLAGSILGLQPCYWPGQFLDYSRPVVSFLGWPDITQYTFENILTAPEGQTIATARTSQRATAQEHTPISAAHSKIEGLPPSLTI